MCINVGCTGSCEFCNPDIPEDIERIPAKWRTHWQLKSTQAGLHPSGNEYNDPKPKMALCGMCSRCQEAYGIPKALRVCTEAINEEHKLIHPKSVACSRFTQVTV